MRSTHVFFDLYTSSQLAMLLEDSRVFAPASTVV